jgi:hypothetical protein
MLGANADLRVRLPPQLFEAVERAAKKKFMTVSEYTRQSLIARLERDESELINAVRNEAAQ